MSSGSDGARLIALVCTIYTGTALAADCSSQKLYWTSAQGVFRADFDGSNQQTILDVGQLSQLTRQYLNLPSWVPSAIAVDGFEGKLYLGILGTIRTDLDGSHPKLITLASTAEIQLDAARRACRRSPARSYWLGNPQNRRRNGSVDHRAKGSAGQA